MPRKFLRPGITGFDLSLSLRVSQADRAGQYVFP
jgi:hypothetical protein